jgi:hypothetical protein
VSRSCPLGAALLADGLWPFALAVTIPVLVLCALWLLREAVQRAADRRALRGVRSRPRQPGAGTFEEVLAKVGLESRVQLGMAGLALVLAGGLACAFVL